MGWRPLQPGTYKLEWSPAEYTRGYAAIIPKTASLSHHNQVSSLHLFVGAVLRLMSRVRTQATLPADLCVKVRPMPIAR